MAIISKNNNKNIKIKSDDIELAMSRRFRYWQNIIVPNIFWSFLNYEADLLILTPSGYATEIEIKVDKYDLIKDKEKKHNHISDKIHKLYFAIPEYLKEYTEHIPKNAGIILIKRINNYSDGSPRYLTEMIKDTKKNNNPKWSVEDRNELLRVAYLRIWKLKEKIIKGANNGSI